jgi:hypothetical protein
MTQPNELLLTLVTPMETVSTSAASEDFLPLVSSGAVKTVPTWTASSSTAAEIRIANSPFFAEVPYHGEKNSSQTDYNFVK